MHGPLANRPRSLMRISSQLPLAGLCPSGPVRSWARKSPDVPSLCANNNTEHQYPLSRLGNEEKEWNAKE